MLRALRHRLAGRRSNGLAERVDRLDERFDRLEAALRESWATTAQSLQQIEELVARRQRVRGEETLPLDGVELRNVLWAIASEESETRRRLWSARDDPAYEAAFTDPDPLVSIIVATRERDEVLTQRSVPSALAQTHENVEVIVVGDAAGPETEIALRALGDDRVRYRNLPHRVTASDENGKHWLVAAAMARNEGARMARGRWVVSLDDDDTLRPGFVERLLDVARSERAEVPYGVVREVRSDGSERRIGEFPPRPGEFSWHGALAHSALLLFDRQHVAADFGMPGDWYLLERMLRTGVRFAFLDDVIADYFPSQG
jgi:hypothetical protein